MNECLDEQKILNRLIDKIKLSRVSDIIKIESRDFTEYFFDKDELTSLYFVDQTRIEIRNRIPGFLVRKRSLAYFNKTNNSYFPDYEINIEKSLYDDLIGVARFLEGATMEERTDRKIREIGL